MFKVVERPFMIPKTIFKCCFTWAKVTFLFISSDLRCFSSLRNLYLCGILPCDDTSSINRHLKKETNNILKPLCSVNLIKFIDQDANWNQMNGSLEPDLFYSNKLHLVEKGNLILAKSVYISVKSHYKTRN